MAEVGTTRSNSQLLLVLGAGVLMLACGAGAYLVVRSPESGTGANPPVTTAAAPADDTVVDTSTTTASTTPTTPVVVVTVPTVPAIAGQTLDAPLFSLVLPTVPQPTQQTSAFGSATVTVTRWDLAIEGNPMSVSAADYSLVIAAGGVDVQVLFDSVVTSASSVAGATVALNESMTIGTDLGRRAVISAAGTWTYVTVLWHGGTLLAVAAVSTSDQPPAAYTAAIDSLVWKA